MSKIKKILSEYVNSNRQISCVTCYDSSFAKILSDSGIDIILVGDSLGMVIKGETNTHSVTMQEIIYHSKCVAKNKNSSILMVDMPINSYIDEESAIKNSQEILKSNVDIVKLEYKDQHKIIIEKLISNDIPVCAHLGYLPQFFSELEDVRIYGKSDNEKNKIFNQAKILDDIGVDVILLECVESDLAKEITNISKTPVIGIGSGDYCNGQVQVLYDIIGVSENPPKFSTNFLQGSKSVEEAIKKYKNHVSKLNTKNS